MVVSQISLMNYYDKEGAVEGQSMLKHKAAESLLEEENYEGLKGD